MEQWVFSVPCLFGLEGLVGNELRRLGLAQVQVDNGRVQFSGGFDAMVWANLHLRMGERVLLRLGSFPARSFSELFDGVRALPWEDLLPKDARFPVKGHSLDSQLRSVPDCQSIVKKAVVTRLGERYGLSWLPETGATYQIQFSIMKDVASLYLDTSGAGLHKRGYRAVGNEAPLRETLAAALVTLARYRGRDCFWDPFCGSGTIVIEAALIAKNRAPGLNRSFAAEQWACVPKALWQQARAEAPDREFHGDYRILGSDVDERSLAIARSNAEKAGVGGLIVFDQRDARSAPLPEPRGTLVCNPPYGTRLMEQRSAQALYRAFGRHLADAAGWNKYILTSEPEFEHYFGQRAVKKRKLYNGMIPCCLFQYFDGEPKTP